MNKKVGHWTDNDDGLIETERQRGTPLFTIFVFVAFVLPWLFGLGAIVGLLFFNGKF